MVSYGRETVIEGISLATKPARTLGLWALNLYDKRQHNRFEKQAVEYYESRRQEEVTVQRLYRNTDPEFMKWHAEARVWCDVIDLCDKIKIQEADAGDFNRIRWFLSEYPDALRTFPLPAPHAKLLAPYVSVLFPPSSE